MGQPFNLALAQAPAGLEGRDARFAWLREVLPEVAAQGADMLLLPELFACGYNIGEAIKTSAESRDGPSFQSMAALASEFGVALHYGYVEQAGDVFYNAAQAVCPEGTRLTHQRKLVLPPGFEQDYFTPGQGCDLFTYRGVKIATLICFDAEFPETMRHVATLGAELVLVPTALGADWDWVARSMIPTRAYENGVYLAYANSAGVQGDMTFLGASVIAGPDGVEAARAGPDSEILRADVDLHRVRAAQSLLPYLKERKNLRF